METQNMNAVSDLAPADTLNHIAGKFAIASGFISAAGVVLLIAMFILFASPYKTLGATVGKLNDICVALQYLLAIPIALALYRILLPHNPALIRLATFIGIVMMLVVIALQVALIFEVIPFERQVGWVSLAMIVGIGSWLMITGLVARSTGRLPNSIFMSAIAVPYIGYPAWAFWLGVHLLSW